MHLCLWSICIVMPLHMSWLSMEGIGVHHLPTRTLLVNSFSTVHCKNWSSLQPKLLFDDEAHYSASQWVSIVGPYKLAGCYAHCVVTSVGVFVVCDVVMLSMLSTTTTIIIELYSWILHAQYSLPFSPMHHFRYRDLHTFFHPPIFPSIQAVRYCATDNKVLH